MDDRELAAAPLVVHVVDDDVDCAKGWCLKIEEGLAAAGVAGTASPIVGDDLVELTGELDTLTSQLRRHEEPTTDALKNCDVLVIDSDLRESDIFKLATGHDLAYAARCLTDVGLVAVLNAYGENPFDLTLRGHPSSFADVHIGEAQLDSPGLWTFGGEGFRPWSWPLLGDAGKRRREGTEWLLAERRLDEPIATHLGFSPADLEAVPRSSAAFITSERASGSPSLATATFREFAVQSDFGLQRRDAMAASKSGEAERVIARVAAARVSFWMNSVLVPAQDVVADGPHLALRFPSALSDRKSLGPGSRAELVNSEIWAAEPFSENRFGNGLFADRPLWWARRLGADNRLPEVSEPWEVEPEPLVFREDDSQLASPDDAIAFACDLDTPHRIRHIKRYDEVVYRPSENLVGAR